MISLLLHTYVLRNVYTVTPLSYFRRSDCFIMEFQNFENTKILETKKNYKKKIKTDFKNFHNSKNTSNCILLYYMVDTKLYRTKISFFPAKNHRNFWKFSHITYIPSAKFFIGNFFANERKHP
jgi:hypothetical protein